MFVVSFVIVDCMVVIAELLMDLRILSLLEDMGTNKKNGEKPEAHYLVPDVLHSISIGEYLQNWHCFIKLLFEWIEKEILPQNQLIN